MLDRLGGGEAFGIGSIMGGVGANASEGLPPNGDRRGVGWKHRKNGRTPCGTHPRHPLQDVARKLDIMFTSRSLWGPFERSQGGVTYGRIREGGVTFVSQRDMESRKETTTAKQVWASGQRSNSNSNVTHGTQVHNQTQQTLSRTERSRVQRNKTIEGEKARGLVHRPTHEWALAVKRCD